jgi:hypothetical protein
MCVEFLRIWRSASLDMWSRCAESSVDGDRNVTDGIHLIAFDIPDGMFRLLKTALIDRS